MGTPKYDCLDCVAYCCSIYELVEVFDADIQRLADHFDLDVEEARRRFTRMAEGRRVLKRRKDTIFPNRCALLDPVTRRCTVYEARPDTCRNYVSGDRDRCVYYDVLQFERKQQGDRDYIPIVEIHILTR